MSRFAKGHRVVVVNPEPEAALRWPTRLVGHWGHVREVLGPWVLVDVEGKIGGEPCPPAVEFELGWAFRPSELEHAD